MKKCVCTKHKILIVDACEKNRSMLAGMLGNGYEFLEAASGTLANAVLQQYGKELSLVLLNACMPDMDGLKILDSMRRARLLDSVPVLLIGAEMSPHEVARVCEQGVTDVITHPLDEKLVRCRVSKTIAFYNKQKRLESMVERKNAENERLGGMLISILSHILELRNGESGSHVMHVHGITELLLNSLVRKTDRYKLCEKDIATISMAASLHDIGKIVIPDNILNKPGRLTCEEFSVMKTHSDVGASLLRELPFNQEEPLIKTAYEICRWHHERYDGKGYPDGLAGEKIPISAQIVSIADVYDALTSERVYKEAIPHAQAMQMIFDGECGTFNPLLLECLQEVQDDIQKVVQFDGGDSHYLSQMYKKRELNGRALWSA